MQSLHLEELESRQLLNSSSFAPPSWSSWHEPRQEFERTWYHEQRSYADPRHGFEFAREEEYSLVPASRATSSNRESRITQSRVDISSFEETYSPSPVRFIPVILASPVYSSAPISEVLLITPAPSVSVVTTAAVVTPELHVSARPLTASVSTAADTSSPADTTVPLATSNATTGSRGVASIVTALAAARNSGSVVPARGSPNPVLVLTPHAEPTAGSAEPVALRTSHGGESGALDASPVTGGPSRAAGLSAPAGSEEMPAGQTEGSLPQFLEVARALTTVELTAAEQGMRQFLTQLEHGGRDMVERGAESTWSLWAVAWGTAVVACELARRQFRRTAPPLQWNHLTGPHDPPREKA